MFTSIRLVNFKSFVGDHTLPAKRISVLIGPNGSGKSSVLQALLVFKESQQARTLATKGSWIDLGDPSDVVSAGCSLSEGKIGFEATSLVSLKAIAKSANDMLCKYTVLCNLEGQNLNFEVKSDALSLSRVSDKLSEREYHLPSGTSLGLGLETNILVPASIRSYPSSEEASVNELNTVLSQASSLIYKLRFIRAMRGFGRARYELGQDVVNDFGREYARNEGFDSQDSALATTLAYDDALLEGISQALLELTGISLESELTPNRRVTPVSVRSSWRGIHHRSEPTNEGFGSNQLIHLVAQVLKAERGATLLVEEPEIHLHPQVQGRLGFWLTKYAIERDLQLLVTTHSEHFLTALLFQVRQERLDPTDLSIHYVDLDSSERSTAKKLDVTHGGLVQGGFRTFFGGPEVPEFQDFAKGLT